MVLASASTGLWVAIGLLLVLKLPLIAALLWLPFRSDSYDVGPAEEDSAGGGDGGGGVPADPDGPQQPSPDRGGGGPHPNSPLTRHLRRGEHGGDRPPAPERVRIGRELPSRPPARQD